MPNFMTFRVLSYLFLLCTLVSCGGSSSSTPESAAPSETPPVMTPVTNVPSIISTQVNTQTVGLYEKIEWSIDANAEYDNPFDQRDVSLNAQFVAPDNSTVAINGYWDTRQGWKIRFAPAQVGEWKFLFTVTNTAGVSEASTGLFTVTMSDKKGWIQPASQISPDYSARYFMHQDETEFYGIGHGDVFAIFRDTDTAAKLLMRLQTAKENYFVWWPQFYFSIVQNSYQHYNQRNIDLIDSVIEQTAQADIKIIFTIWDHSQLRDSTHAWDDGRWNNNNGFNQLTSASDFFTNEESWQWQKNLYRYVIARWGHSSAIGMWQPVSEIDGTNAFENTNAWHQKTNAYFAENDPYRHPITSSMAGDKSWQEGHEVMDVLQVHIYRDLLTDKDNTRSDAKIIESAAIIANYTTNMWNSQNKPNWIGEFGVINNLAEQTRSAYPEVFHNALWAGLSSGAAMTPSEWNDFSDWGQVTSSMEATLQVFSRFVDSLSLAKWSPEQLTITHPNNLKSWGISGKDGGMIWIQDIRLIGQTITDIRTQVTPYDDTSIEVLGLIAGNYQVTPYDTRLGVFLPPSIIRCEENSPCIIAISSFNQDIALTLARL